jgi:outer membrane protein assembly factor BamB
MIYRGFLLLLFLPAVIFLFSACDVLEPDPTPTPSPIPRVLTPTPVSPAVPQTGFGERPPEVEQAAHEWPLPNKDYGNSRATFDSDIDSTNVSDLEAAWAFPIPGIGSYGGGASNPLIINGVVYFQDLQSNVFAIDLESGEVLWEHMIEESVIGPNGPAAGWGKIFAQGGLQHIFALDMETGERVWDSVLQGPTGAQQPTAYGGYLFTAIVAGAVDAELPGAVESRRGYAGGTTGIAYAMDQETGQIIWSWQAVEEGFWGNPEINSGGGIWFTPAIDIENGVTYWGTGNPAPFPGILDYPNAASRPGPNLYTNSLVALDMESGELLWYNQVKPRDLFDLDFQLPPILPEDEPDLILMSGKLGIVYAFDRQSGEIAWETSVGEHMNDNLQELPLGEEVFVMPGVWGGVETPMAYADGVVYALVLNLGTPYTATGFNAADGTEAVANATGRTQLETATSEVVAIDAASGEILWEVHFDAPAFGAVTVVNDLVFTAMFDGMIYALSREDGSIAWSYHTPGGINAWPAVAGDTIVWPVGVGREPVLLALRLGAEGGAEVIATPIPTP